MEKAFVLAEAFFVGNISVCQSELFEDFSRRKCFDKFSMAIFMPV